MEPPPTKADTPWTNVQQQQQFVNYQFILPKRPINTGCEQQNTSSAHSGNYVHPIPPQPQQAEKKQCCVCCITEDDDDLTCPPVFLGRPGCNNCYQFLYRRRTKIKELSDECAHKDKSGEELHGICRENPKKRAGYETFANCKKCVLRLCRWVKFDIDKMGSYTKCKNQGPSKKMKMNDEESVEIVDYSRMKWSRESLQVNCAADLTRVMALFNSTQYFTELNADKFMRTFNGKGIALEFLVADVVKQILGGTLDPRNWSVLACHVEQDGEYSEAYLQRTLNGLKLDYENEQIERKARFHSDNEQEELTKHLVWLDDKKELIEEKQQQEHEEATTNTKKDNNNRKKKLGIEYFTGAYCLKDIPVSALRVWLEYLRKNEAKPYEDDVASYGDEVFIDDRIYTPQGRRTPRAISLVLNNINCQFIISKECTELFKEVFNGFCYFLIIIERMDGFKTFDFGEFQHCKCFVAAKVIAFRKNPDANATNAPKICAKAYVKYVNAPWKFPASVCALPLGQEWFKQSHSKNGQRDLNFSVLQYVPTMSADADVCNLMASLLLTEPFLEDLFLGPGRVHFIDIELLSGLNENVTPQTSEFTTVFTDLIDQLKKAFMNADSVVSYTLFIAGPKVDPWPNSSWTLNRNGELLMVLRFELKKSDRLLVLVQRFLPKISQSSTSTSSSTA